MNKQVIYTPHSAGVIDESLNTFADNMRNGADVESLLAGKLALDFICYASDMTPWQKERREYLELEADMRIDLAPRINSSTPSVDDILTQLEAELRRHITTSR